MTMRTMWFIVVAAVLLPVLAGCSVGSKKGNPEFTNSLGMRFVRIDSGSFRMGSDHPDLESSEQPVHDVTLTKGFELQATEVTQAQWQAVMGRNPSHFKGPDLPVESVSWEDVQEFLQKLSAREKGTPYRLPTEAEWEYACRAGGQEPDEAVNLGREAWYAENSGGGSEGTTHPVGRKKPNAWGLYDMRGNVEEWVQDWYGPYSPERQIDPQGPSYGEYRVVRGGSYFGGGTGRFMAAPNGGFTAEGGNNFRAAFRHLHAKPDYRMAECGFRCARTL
jgi:formylglycine-generating enzyme required for sulfatase activity